MTPSRRNSRMINVSHRQSMGSDPHLPLNRGVSSEYVRRPSGMYRGVGAMTGGVEPLFEFEEEGMELGQLEEEDEEVEPGQGVEQERRPLVLAGREGSPLGNGKGGGSPKIERGGR